MTRNFLYGCMIVPLEINELFSSTGTQKNVTSTCYMMRRALCV